MAANPDPDDVIVRASPDRQSGEYTLGTSATPHQFRVRSRSEAVSQALTFAKRHRVRAWLSTGVDLELLGGFRRDPTLERRGKKKRTD